MVANTFKWLDSESSDIICFSLELSVWKWQIPRETKGIEGHVLGKFLPAGTYNSWRQRTMLDLRRRPEMRDVVCLNAWSFCMKSAWLSTAWNTAFFSFSRLLYSRLVPAFISALPSPRCPGFCFHLSLIVTQEAKERSKLMPSPSRAFRFYCFLFFRLQV